MRRAQVFVRGLAFKARPQELVEFFSSCGEVLRIEVGESEWERAREKGRQTDNGGENEREHASGTRLDAAASPLSPCTFIPRRAAAALGRAAPPPPVAASPPYN